MNGYEENYREIFLSNKAKSHRKYPSNSSTVILKFYKPEVEMVKQLKFFNPDNNSVSFRNKSQYTPNISNEESLANPSILFLRPKKEQNENKKKGSSLKYNHKWDNMNFEANFESKRKNHDERIKEFKYEIKRLYNIVGSLKKEKEELDYSKDILENFSKYNHEEEKMMKKMSVVGKRMDKLTEMEFEKISNFKRMLDAKANKRLEDLKEVKEKIIKIKEKINIVKEEIDNKQKNLKNHIEEGDKIKLSLLDHYHKLLKEGKDTRKEGLVWIVKAIWNLGHKVSPAFIPSFLDEQLISYLFNYSLIDVESKKIKKKLDEAHIKMKLKQENVSEESKRLLGNFFKTSSQENYSNDINYDKNPFTKSRTQGMKTQSTFNLMRAHSMSLFDANEMKSIVSKLKFDNDFENKYISLKSIEMLVNSPRETIDKESMNFVNEMRDMETKLINIQNYLVEMKKIELNRISFEFVKKDYERRFNVMHEEVVSVIVGEDNTSNEISKQKREEKKYYDQMNKTRSFNLSEGFAKKMRNSQTSLPAII